MNQITNDIQKTVLPHKKGVKIHFQVLPRSSQSKITGLHDETVKIKLTKPPVDGQANAECCRVAAKFFGVPKSRVSIIRGETSRHKTVLIEGMTVFEASNKLKDMFAN